MTRSLLARRAWIVSLVLIAATGLAACGEADGGASGSTVAASTDAGSLSGGESGTAARAGSGDGERSIATGRVQVGHVTLTEADAGRAIEVEYYDHDIGLPDKKGLEIFLSGDDASTLRWSMPVKPDSFMMEWHAVDGKLAFETDGLIGDPATAAKVLEFRATREGETRVVLELVERDPAARSGAPAKRLEYTFQVPTPRFRDGASGYGVPF